jgi:hypothetical protein
MKTLALIPIALLLAPPLRAGPPSVRLQPVNIHFARR